MVEFLTSIVQQHVSKCPELKKILDLRDTVLTGRVKKAFPEVEYKRKQIKEDHYRKAYLWKFSLTCSWIYRSKTTLICLSLQYMYITFCDSGKTTIHVSGNVDL